MANKITKLMLNGEEYLIREYQGGGWQPGANTVAYYPLDTDFSDQSGNGYDLTNNGGVITSLNGVGCAYYNGSSYSKVDGIDIGTTRTFVAWMDATSLSNVMAVIDTGTDSQYSNMGIQINNSKVYAGQRRSNDTSIGNTTLNTNQRYLVGVVLDDNKTRVMVNGVFDDSGRYTQTFTVASESASQLAIGSKSGKNGNVYSEKFYGYISRVIFEDKAWTEQEFTDYFNQTKSLYGIS